MVRTITSLGTGLYDWLVQRISAVVIASYVVFMIGYLMCQPSVDYITWKALFSCTAVKVFTVLMLLSVLLHAWAGLWIISTDYLKCTAVRVVFQAAFIVANVAFFAWGLIILWSV